MLTYHYAVPNEQLGDIHGEFRSAESVSDRIEGIHLCRGGLHLCRGGLHLYRGGLEAVMLHEVARQGDMDVDDNMLDTKLNLAGTRN